MIAGPRHAEVLSAIAVAMRMRASLPEALARLAAEDPALAAWTQPVERRLRQGARTSEALGALIDAPCRADLEAGVDPAESLSRNAVRATRPTHRTWWCLHLPLLLALLLACPRLLVDGILTVAHLPGAIDAHPVQWVDWVDPASPFGSLLVGLLLVVLIDVSAFARWLLLATSVVAGLTMAVGGTHLLYSVEDITPLPSFGYEEEVLHLVWSHWAWVLLIALPLAVVLARQRLLTVLPALWSSEVVRQQALLHLIRDARRGETAPCRVPMALRPLAWLGLWPARDGDPRWASAWRTWFALTRWRIDRQLRRSLAHLPDLPMRLVILGIVPTQERVPLWSEAEAQAEHRLDTALRTRRVLLYPVLLLSACGGVLLLFLDRIDTLLFSSTLGQSMLQNSPFELPMMVGSVLGIVISLTLLQAAVRWCLAGSPPEQVRALARTLEQALRERRPLAEALDGLRTTLPFPTPFRLRRAAARLREHPETPLGNVLGEHRLLSPQIAALLSAAQVLHPDLLLALLARLGMEERLPGRILRHALPTMATLAVLIGLCIVPGFSILSRYDAVFQELGVALSRDTRWAMWVAHEPWLVLALLFGTVVSIVAVVRWWQWRQLRRLLLGQLLLLAADARIPESAVAAALLPDGECPSFRSLCHGCGWEAQDPASLARGWHQADARLTRTLVVAGTTIEAVCPVLLGIMVLEVCRITYGPLFTILRALGSSL